MSHVVTLQTEFRDVSQLKATCDRLGITCRVAEEGQEVTSQLYSGQAKGVVAFRPEGWNYDVVVDKNGKARFDNYGERWGKTSELHKIQQAYSRDLVVSQFESQGYRLEDEQTQANGTIELSLVA